MNANNWSFWAFPEPPREIAMLPAHGPGNQRLMFHLACHGARGIPPETELVVSDHLDGELASYVRSGGKCLLLTGDARIQDARASASATDPFRQFRTIRWNAGDHGNSGTVVTDHPSLRDFPHEGRCDLNFASMLKGRVPMDFGALIRHGVEPVIRVIDHYRSNHNNAHLLEFRVGRGKVLASSLGILENLRGRIEARYLLWCLIRYCESGEFSPRARLPEARFLELFGPRGE